MGECEHIRALVDAYLDGELDPASVDQVVPHFLKCRHCFSHYEFKRTLKQLVRRRLQDQACPQKLRNEIESKI